MNIDLGSEPIGFDPNGQAVYLEDIWPTDEEINGLIRTCLKPGLFASEYGAVFSGDDLWKNLEVEGGLTFAWDAGSSYVKAPPYFEEFSAQPGETKNISGARVLLALGNNVTTDHISPAGSIPADYPAGRYLIESGVKPEDFNSYGARRGNHEVMMRGTFGNIRIKNRLMASKEGGFTRKFPERNVMFIYDAALSYNAEKVPLIVIGGSEYGTGSSRDWAAKGTMLLGVKAVLAESFERIHRSNLVGMGVLPLTFKDGQNFESLGLDGSEVFQIQGVENIQPRQIVKVVASKSDGMQIEFEAMTRLNSALEVAYFKNGGILPFVLRKILTN